MTIFEQLLSQLDPVIKDVIFRCSSDKEAKSCGNIIVSTTAALPGILNAKVVVEKMILKIIDQGSHIRWPVRIGGRELF